MADAQQFRLELDRFGELIKEKGVAYEKQIAAELFSAVVLATPVGNATRWKGNVARAAKGKPPLPPGYVGGQARRNWRLSIGSVSPGVQPGTDPSGQATLASAYGVLGTLREPRNLFISNPLPYMEPLENGWSKQAPDGMLRQAARAIAAKHGLRFI